MGTTSILLENTRKGVVFSISRVQNILALSVWTYSSTTIRERGITVSLRNLLRLVLAIGVCGTAGPVWAYDPSPNIGTDLAACDQVIFSTFTPPPFSAEKNNVTVAPKSEFSFLASKATTSASIMVKIKEEKVPVTVTSVGYGFQVKGKLPPNIKGSYIRLDIFAKGPGDCDKTDGWLLKVGN